MDLHQLSDALAKVFNEDKARIVFWNDPEGEFADVLLDVLVEDVTVLRLDQVGALEAKIRIEREDTEGRYLLYSPFEEPDYDDDWLLDIRLYSRSFRADRASIILDELGLSRQQLRQHIAARRKFFDSKERLRKLKALVDPADAELDLDRKMLAVVTRADQPELFSIVRTLFHSMTEGPEIDLEQPAPAWEQIERFELDGPFWDMVEASFGYREETPSLRNLLIRLMVSDYAHALRGELPSSMQHLQLPRTGTANAVVCLDQWRDSSSKGESFNRLSAVVGPALHVADAVQHVAIEDLLEVVTFLEVEKQIVQGLLARVQSTADSIDAASVRNIVSQRQAGHWVSSATIPEPQRRARHAVYEALAVAAELFALRNEHREGFPFATAVEMYAAYEGGLYRFDQLYRHFCRNADTAASQGWDVLKPLREEVEACYCNFYLAGTALAWGKHLGSGLLERWRIDGVQNQYEFYERRVRPWLDKEDRRRAFVVISDALRYEVAQELTYLLNGTYRFEAELSSQLGVLPSYTALGMASLLPHQQLEYDQKGAVLVDGKPAASLAQRSEILTAVEGIAVKADDLLAMKKEEGREFVADNRVVYVYHNEIDADGDKAVTEGDTFEAVSLAISELADLVRLHRQQPQRVLCRCDRRPRLPFHRDPAERDRQEQAGREAPRHGSCQEALPARARSSRVRGRLAWAHQQSPPGPKVAWSSGFPRVRTASTSPAEHASSTGGPCCRRSWCRSSRCRHVKTEKAAREERGPGTSRSRCWGRTTRSPRPSTASS